MIKRKRWIIAFLLLLTLCWQIETSVDAACKQFMINSGNNSCYSRLSELDHDFCSEFDEVDEYNVSIFSCIWSTYNDCMISIRPYYNTGGGGVSSIGEEEPDE